MALSKAEKQFLDTLSKLGITDEKSQATAMAQIKGESNFIPREENLNYTPKRLVQIFPNKFKDENEARMVIGQGKRALAERIYGGRSDLGNTTPGDGYTYRGRGFIQLTGKDNYARIGKLIGVDLVNNPDLANDPDVAAKIAATYLVQRSPNLQDVAATTKAVGPANTEESIAKRTAYAQDYAEKIAKANEPPPPPDTSMPTFAVTDPEFGGAVPETVPGAEEQAQITQQNKDRVAAIPEDEEGGAVGGILQNGWNVVPAEQVMGTSQGLDQVFGSPALASGVGSGAGYTGPVPGFQAQSSKVYSPVVNAGGSAGTARMPQAGFGSPFYSPAISRVPTTMPSGTMGVFGVPQALSGAQVPQYNPLALQYLRNKLFG